MKNLVIVESPTKARTLQRFLGSDYRIEASMGHIRDLPKSEFGIDIEHNFDPKYIIPRDKKKKVNELKKLAKDADTLWLATDPDREGEAIAWHLAWILGDADTKKQKTPFHRVEFHEITESAIKDAFNHPREIDEKLVDAQQARRVLDRLVGYKLSPLLWKKVKRGLSAGRVQSVALKLIVEREREVLAFKPVEYWSIEAELDSARGPAGKQPHRASSVVSLPAASRRGAPLAVTPRSSETSFIATVVEYSGKKLEVHDGETAKVHVQNLENSDYSVSKITKKEVRRFPAPPFTTSTLQQAASNRLGMTAKKTMMLAQNLYEHGFITYMRTDSFNLAASAVDSARVYIKQNFGEPFLPSAPKTYKSKSKNAQEAHEAIRPTNVAVKSDDLASENGLTRDHAKLYELIWKRFLACQMNEAVLDQTSVDVIARPRSGEAISVHEGDPSSLASPNPQDESLTYLLRTSGSVIRFEGWMKLFPKTKETKSTEEETSEDDKDEQKILPELSEKEILNLLGILPNQHFTEPPPRFNEASLIKKLEELGIGRPSTYAPILSTIQERFYVERIERKFIPTALGMAVNDFIVKYFPEIVDFQFTAQMEDELDEISRGERVWQPTIKEFYTPFAKQLEKTEATAEHVQLELEKVDKPCPECGKDLVVRTGKFGKFLACSGFPDCKHTEPFEQKIDAKCPLDGGEVVVRKTKTGKTFYGCKNWPNCKFASWTKPKSVNEEKPATI